MALLASIIQLSVNGTVIQQEVPRWIQIKCLLVALSYLGQRVWFPGHPLPSSHRSCIKLLQFHGSLVANNACSLLVVLAPQV